MNLQVKILPKLRFHCTNNLMHKNENYLSCAHKIWMNHNFLNQMIFFFWRFPISRIFWIWHNSNSSHFFLCKFVNTNTMCCRNHKMGRNNWSRAEIVKRIFFSKKISVMKWYHKVPFFFWGRKSVINYVFKDTFKITYQS